MNHPTTLCSAVTGTSSLRFSLRYATPRQDAVAGEIHPDTVVPPYRAGEILEKIIYKEENYALQGAIFEVYKKWA